MPWVKRLLFSIDDLKTNLKVGHSKRKFYLEPSEMRNLKRYIFPYIYNFKAPVMAVQANGQWQRLGGTRSNKNFAGPLPEGHAALVGSDSSRTEFEHEGGYRYEFEPQRLKMKEVPKEDLVFYFPNFAARTQLADTVYTEASFQRDHEQTLRRLRKSIFREKYPLRSAAGEGSLYLDVSGAYILQEDALNTLLIRSDEKGSLRVYPGRARDFHGLPAGEYEVIFLVDSSSYYRITKLQVREDGRNFYRRPLPKISPNSPFASEFGEALDKWFQERRTPKMKVDEKLDYHRIYSKHFAGPNGYEISGYVVDERGEPVMLASVFEAVMGAIYIDANFELCREIVGRVFGEQLKDIEGVQIVSEPIISEYPKGDGVIRVKGMSFFDPNGYFLEVNQYA